ncbi:MAG: FixH family protein [Desulfovibrio sp.]|nr:FixH family protein [Desulfovibrio sp.]
MEKITQEYTWTLRTANKSGVVQVGLTLRDAGGSPVKGRSVKGEVWMPDMPMPGYPAALEFQEADAGQYLALVQYGHGGYWQIKAEFTDDKGQMHRQSFDCDIAE